MSLHLTTLAALDRSFKALDTDEVTMELTVYSDFVCAEITDNTRDELVDYIYLEEDRKPESEAEYSQFVSRATDIINHYNEAI